MLSTQFSVHPIQVRPKISLSLQHHKISLENHVGLSFIRSTEVVYFTLVCFLSLPLLPQFQQLRIVEIILSDMYSLSS